MHTLICLLSGQAAPNLQVCVKLAPDRILLVETGWTRKENSAQKFLKACEYLKIHAEHVIVELPDGEDNNFPFLRDFFQRELLEKYPDDRFSVSLTGGTKPMNIALYDVLRDEPNVEFYYIDFLRPNEIINLNTNEKTPAFQKFPLQAFLAGYGFEFAKEMKNIQKAESYATNRTETSKILAKFCNDSKFRIWSATGNDFLAWKKKAMKARKPQTIEPGILHPTIPEVTQALAARFHLTVDKNGDLVGTLTKYDIQYLDGGWLEEFIWTTLSKFQKQYHLTDLCLGLEIRQFGSSTSNELDISFMRNNTFHVMECKTGLQDKMQDNTYKIFAVTKQLQALRTQAYLISNSPNLETVVGRAETQRTVLINAESIRNLAINPEEELDKIFK